MELHVHGGASVEFCLYAGGAAPILSQMWQGEGNHPVKEWDYS